MLWMYLVYRLFDALLGLFIRLRRKKLNMRVIDDPLSGMVCNFGQLSACVYIQVVARSNSCKNVVLRGCGRLRGSISYFLATKSSQMNAEAVNDVDPKY